jgi:hypothetical protein
VRGGDLELGYLFNSSFSVKGYAKYEKLHQPAQREQDTDKLVGLEFRKQVTRRSSLELLVERYARNANVASGFVENRATLTWRYQPLQDPRGLNFDPYRGRGLRQPNRAPQTQRDNLPVR